MKMSTALLKLHKIISLIISIAIVLSLCSCSVKESFQCDLCGDVINNGKKYVADFDGEQICACEDCYNEINGLDYSGEIQDGYNADYTSDDEYKEDKEEKTDTIVQNTDTAVEIKANRNGFIDAVPGYTTVPDGYIGIYTPEEFDSIRNNANANYMLMADLDLSGFEVWKTIEKISGVFDGNGHTITGIKSIEPIVIDNSYGADDVCYSVFGDVYEIRNLGIYGVDIILSPYDGYSGNVLIGGLSARATNILNCYVAGTIWIKDFPSVTYGGICASATRIYDCWSELSAGFSECKYSVMGGIVGNGWTVERCYNNGVIQTVSPSSYCIIGGIVAYAIGEGDLMILDSHNSGNFYVDNSETAFCGGIVGMVCVGDLRIKRCYNTGTIEAHSTDYSSESNVISIGGIASGVTSQGYTYYIDECYNRGDISVISDANCLVHLGGIVGSDNMYRYSMGIGMYKYYCDTYVTNCFNVGTLNMEAENSESSCGGIAGKSVRSAVNCYNAGDVSASANIKYIGAITGDFDSASSSIDNCRFVGENTKAVGINALFENVKSVDENDLAKDMIEIDSSVWEKRSGISCEFPLIKGVYWDN